MDALTLLPEFKTFVRVLGDDMDDVLLLALTAGIAESAAYLGRSPVGTVADELLGVMYLGRAHFDDADADRCRQVGRLMLFPTRTASGIGGA